jgi:hypothetical protein
MTYFEQDVCAWKWMEDCKEMLHTLVEIEFKDWKNLKN